MKKTILPSIFAIATLLVTNLSAQEATGPNGEIISSSFIQEIEDDSFEGLFSTTNTRSSGYARTNKISGPMTLTSIKSATGWDCTASSFALSKALLKLKNNDKATFKLFNKASGIPALKGKYKINGNKLNVRTKTKKFFLSGFMRKFVSKVKANKNKMTIKLTYSLFAEGKAPVCKFNYTGKFKK